MISLPGDPGVHIWDPKEFEARGNEAKKIAETLFLPEEVLSRNRFLNLAIFLSEKPWEKVKLLPKKHLMSVMEAMVRSGCPLDLPSPVL